MQLIPLPHSYTVVPKTATKPKQSPYFISIAVTLFAVLVINNANAQQQEQNELKTLQSEINSLDKNINKKEKQLGSEKSEIQRLEKEISGTQAEVDGLDNDINGLTSKIGELQANVTSQKASVEKQLRSLEKIMVKQYKNNDTLFMKMMLNQDDPEKLDRMQKYYKYYSNSQANVIESQREEIESYLIAEKTLRQEQAALDKAKADKATLMLSLEDKKQGREKNILALDNAITTDANKLGRLKLDQDRLKKLIKELQYQAKQREIAKIKAEQERLAKIKADQARAEKARAEQARIEKARQESLRQQQLAQNNKAPSGNAVKRSEPDQETITSVGQTASPSTTQSTTATATNDIKVEKNQPRVEPSTPYAGLGKLKGKLPYPLKGRVIASFGAYKADSGLTWSGIMIETKEGAAVSSVADGEVVYADWFRGYGQMIVVDHGKGYMSLYSHNSRITKGVGSRVKQNEEIALAGNSGGLKYAGLYFELRYNGQPVNPASYLR